MTTHFIYKFQVLSGDSDQPSAKRFNFIPMAEEYPKIYLYKRIVQAKLFMDEHFCEKIDLDNIADEACFSKFHFIRLFKSIYGITPHQYLIRSRIERSMEMLQSGHTVSATCLGVGFESLSTLPAFLENMPTAPLLLSKNNI